MELLVLFSFSGSILPTLQTKGSKLAKKMYLILNCISGPENIDGLDFINVVTNMLC